MRQNLVVIWRGQFLKNWLKRTNEPDLFSICNKVLRSLLTHGILLERRGNGRPRGWTVKSINSASWEESSRELTLSNVNLREVSQWAKTCSLLWLSLCDAGCLRNDNHNKLQVFAN